MAPVLPSALISTFTRPFPGHLSSGLGTLDASSSPADIAQALVDRCEAALRTMQENLPKGAGGSGAWVIRRCEAHVWSEVGRRGMRGFGRDEAILLFAGVMMGICLHGLYITLFGPGSTAEVEATHNTEEGSILLHDNESDHSPRIINHAQLNAAVIDEKSSLPKYTASQETDSGTLPAYTDEPDAKPVQLEGEAEAAQRESEARESERAVVGPYDDLFIMLHRFEGL